MSDTPKFNTNDPEAAEIRRKAAAVGAQLGDVITIEEVREFERQAGVKLPEDYVWFITNVGNGGTWKKCLPGKRYIFGKLPPNGDVDNFAHYASGYSFPNGKDKFALCVLDLGDGYGYGIILTGEHFGEICDICDSEYAYYDEDNGRTVHNFKELYTAWLDDEYLGYDTDYFDRRLRGTVEELFRKYLDRKEEYYLESIALKINKNSVSKEFIEQVHAEFMREYNNEKQMALFYILMACGYTDRLSIIKRIYRPKNYINIIGCLKGYYFEDWLKAEGVMDGAEEYYPILVEMLKYLNTLTEFPFDGLDFKQCFEMTVMNPKFNENDIAEVLNSKNKVILELITHTYAEPVLNRVGKYVEAAKKKIK